jgi:dienelactone hydrolase
VALTALAAAPAAADPGLAAPWPDPAGLTIRGEPVRFASISPFVIADAEGAPPTEAVGTLFMPPGASAEDPVPAVIMLHGAAGVLDAREMTYGEQFAAMGVAALVIDSFAARRDFASGFINRLLNITESMILSDAYRGLAFLDAMPEVDGSRVALVGFSYGGMATILAAFEQVAERLSPSGLRFAGHVAFYPPCIAVFDDARATGAPLLILSGSGDALVDEGRCAEIGSALHAGGAAFRHVIFDGAYHQWDGGRAGPRPIGRNLADCRLLVRRDGTVRDTITFLPMSGPTTRQIILGVCSDPAGYLIGSDDAVRIKSNAEMGGFLEGVLFPPS